MWRMLTENQKCEIALGFNLNMTRVFKIWFLMSPDERTLHAHIQTQHLEPHLASMVTSQYVKGILPFESSSSIG